MDLYNDIKEMIIEAVSLEEKLVVPEANLQDDLGADSLAILNLAESISTRYGIDLQGDDIVDVDTVGELVKLVASKISP